MDDEFIVPTLYELFDHHASRKFLSFDGAGEGAINPNYEPSFERKYRISKRTFEVGIRIVFLGSMLRDKRYEAGFSRIVRSGVPIWCYDLKYEGLSDRGYRQFSFNLEKESKRFLVEERYALLVPSRSGVTPKFYDGYTHRCRNFGSVFSYAPALQVMHGSAECTSLEGFCENVRQDNPVCAGALVSPRLGLFSVKHRKRTGITNGDSPFPYGLVLNKEEEAIGSAGNLFGRELFRVMFGDEIYDGVHPNELEIINNVQNIHKDVLPVLSSGERPVR